MPKLYEVPAAAATWSVSTWTVRKKIKSGEIRAVRIGRRVLIPESEIERIATPVVPTPAAGEVRNDQ